MARKRHYSAKGGDPAFRKRYKPHLKETTSEKQPIPKRKYAIIFGYLGTGYHGMQKQVNDENENRCKTIEGVLEQAIKDCSGITQAQIDQPHRLQWGRVGRTDKGVHAACQVVTLKMSLGPITPEEIKIFEEGFPVQNTNDGEYEGVEVASATPAAMENFLLDSDIVEARRSKKELAVMTQRARERRFAESLQAALPPEFEIYDVVKVAGLFDARLRANRRQYEYCLPISVLRPAVLVDNTDNVYKFYKEFVNAQDTSDLDNVFVSFEEKKKIFDIVRTERLSQSETVDTPGQSVALSPAIQELSSTAGELVLRWREELSFLRRLYASLDGCKRLELWDQYPDEPRKAEFVPPFAPVSLLAIRPPFEHEVSETTTEEDIERFEKALIQYHGNHHWYNFTSRISHDDQSGVRYIEQIDVHRSCVDPKLLVVRLRGQSFLLNQIRKMISGALEVTMGLAPSMTPTWLYTHPLHPKRHLHLSPGEGLLLERAHFDVINRQRDEIYTRMILHHEYEQKAPHASHHLVTNLTTLENEQIEELQSEEKPIWWRILKFKVERVYPWISKVFQIEDVWTRFKADLAWHPFISENFPSPVGPHEPERPNKLPDVETLSETGPILPNNKPRRQPDKFEKENVPEQSVEYVNILV